MSRDVIRSKLLTTANPSPTARAAQATALLGMDLASLLVHWALLLQPQARRRELGQLMQLLYRALLVQIVGPRVPALAAAGAETASTGRAAAAAAAAAEAVRAVGALSEGETLCLLPFLRAALLLHTALLKDPPDDTPPPAACATMAGELGFLLHRLGLPNPHAALGAEGSATHGLVVAWMRQSADAAAANGPAALRGVAPCVSVVVSRLHRPGYTA